MQAVALAREARFAKPEAPFDMFEAGFTLSDLEVSLGYLEDVETALSKANDLGVVTDNELKSVRTCVNYLLQLADRAYAEIEEARDEYASQGGEI